MQNYCIIHLFQAKYAEQLATPYIIHSSFLRPRYAGFSSHLSLQHALYITIQAQIDMALSCRNMQAKAQKTSERVHFVMIMYRGETNGT